MGTAAGAQLAAASLRATKAHAPRGPVPPPLPTPGGVPPRRPAPPRTKGIPLPGNLVLYRTQRGGLKVSLLIRHELRAHPTVCPPTQALSSGPPCPARRRRGPPALTHRHSPTYPQPTGLAHHESCRPSQAAAAPEPHARPAPRAWLPAAAPPGPARPRGPPAPGRPPPRPASPANHPRSRPARSILSVSPALPEHARRAGRRPRDRGGPGPTLGGEDSAPAPLASRPPRARRCAPPGTHRVSACYAARAAPSQPTPDLGRWWTPVSESSNAGLIPEWLWHHRWRPARYPIICSSTTAGWPFCQRCTRDFTLLHLTDRGLQQLPGRTDHGLYQGLILNHPMHSKGRLQTNRSH